MYSPSHRIQKLTRTLSSYPSPTHTKASTPAYTFQLYSNKSKSGVSAPLRLLIIFCTVCRKKPIYPKSPFHLCFVCTNVVFMAKANLKNPSQLVLTFQYVYSNMCVHYRFGNSRHVLD